MARTFKSIPVALAVLGCIALPSSQADAEMKKEPTKISFATIASVAVSNPQAASDCGNLREEIMKIVPDAKVPIVEYRPVSTWQSIRLGATAFVDPQKFASVSFVSGTDLSAKSESGGHVVDWSKINTDNKVVGIGTTWGNSDTLCVIDMKYIDAPTDPSDWLNFTSKGSGASVKLVTKYDDKLGADSQGYFSVMKQF